MRAINKLLIPAENALKATGIVNQEGVVKEGVQEGYIAGFGAMVINLDLLPTVAVYMEEPKRKQVLDALAKTLNPVDTANTLFENLKGAEGSSLAARRLLKERVVNASVALKMMIRTFKIIKTHD